MIRDADNRIGKLLAAGKTDAEMLDEFYLAALSRRADGRDEAKKLLGAFVGEAAEGPPAALGGRACGRLVN